MGSSRTATSASMGASRLACVYEPGHYRVLTGRGGLEGLHFQLDLLFLFLSIHTVSIMARP